MWNAENQDKAREARAAHWAEPAAPAPLDPFLTRSGPFHRFQQTLHLAGGLNILGDSPYAIAVFVFAVGVALSAALIMQVSYEGASVVVYHNVFIVYLLLAMMISFGPLLIFIGNLDGLRQRGLRDYGTLANRHAQLFNEKWIERAGVTEDIV